MNPDEVLNAYLNSVNRNLDELQNYLASNSVLEWFGKTFRTSRKIIEGFRYDLCEQYEHNFTKAEYCSPFDDSKETHLITRKIPPENLIELNLVQQDAQQQSTSSSSPGASGGNNLDGYITPPQIKRSPILPKLTQGRKFLSDSDTDSDSEEKSEEIKNRKYGVDLKGTTGQEESERMNANLCRNTIKRTCLKRNEANISRSDNEDEDDTEQQPQSKIKKTDNDNEPEAGDSTNKYSELKYIQTTGMVKQIRLKKHRGIIGSTTAAGPISSPSSSSSTSGPSDLLHLTPSTTAYERTACLKISYRLHLVDNHIQFALIIYDALNKNPKTRRNLFNEFQKISLPNKLHRRGDASSSKKKSDPQNSTSSSLNNSSYTISKKSLRF